MTTAVAVPEQSIRLKIYEVMAKIKLVDETVRNLLMSGQIAIVYYSARGQECIPAAFAAACGEHDYVVTNYRNIHDSISTGIPLDQLLAEMLGKVTGTCKGKGGPMHISDPTSGLMVTTGIVGGGIPIANGLALASQVKGDGRVTVCHFGDGATNIGAFHEALNLAAVWNLPVVFVCQNNEYGEYTKRLVTQKVAHISERAAAYGIPGVTVDGNDPDATYLAARTAVERARGGRGPTLLEATTYRFMGHLFGDQMPYMPTEELAAAVQADPVPRYRALLVSEGAASESELAALDARLASEVQDAAAKAQSAPLPDPEELFTDVYAEGVLA